MNNIDDGNGPGNEASGEREDASYHAPEGWNSLRHLLLPLLFVLVIASVGFAITAFGIVERISG